MQQQGSSTSAFILGLFVCLGFLGLGYLLGSAALDFKQYDRSVTVKGLSEFNLPLPRMTWNNCIA